ncbi:MAG: energy-coupling factor transporter transmembrane component T [Candidatus Bathyarchaeia archaeon]|nr:energy-coupling factor transporter transmembrane protein EcfT [Candidatus Bathyarchaeota archaeon]
MSIFEGLRFKTISSPIHRIDPRAKFIYVCVLFAIAVLFSQLIPLLILFFSQMPLIIIAKLKREWLRLMRGSMFFAAIIFIANMVSLYFYGGTQSLAAVVEHSLAMTTRFLILVESFSIFFATTSPDMLSLSLEQIGVPYEFCFAFTTAIRFVPVLAEEAQTIMDAQKARGLELERGNFIKRVKNYIPILIPLIVSAIRRSMELAEAMESRAWGASKKRTSLYSLKMKTKDYIFIVASIIVLLVSIYVRFFISIPSVTELMHLG